MNEVLQHLRNRWLAAAHAVQAGVTMMMHTDQTDTEPKHLRVGLNMVMSDLGGLSTLLIAKGVITREEYFEALADAAEREKASYEEQLSKFYKQPVTLG